MSIWNMREKVIRNWTYLFPLERLTFLRGKGTFPKSSVPNMLKALSRPLPIERVTREEWNWERLSSEVGGNQECVVLDSAVPLSSWDNGQVISLSGLSPSSPHPVLKERVQMGDKVKENGYCFNLKTLYFPLFILLRTWEFKYLGFS